MEGQAFQQFANKVSLSPIKFGLPLLSVYRAIFFYVLVPLDIYMLYHLYCMQILDIISSQQ